VSLRACHRHVARVAHETDVGVVQSARQAQDNNITLVLIIVVIVFSVCQAPALLNQIFWNVLDDDARKCGGFQFYYSRVSNMLVVLNSAVNFPIYAVFNTRFRQVLVGQVLGCCFRWRGTAIGIEGDPGGRRKLAATERFREVASMIPSTVGAGPHNHCYVAMNASGCVPVAHEMKGNVGDKQREAITISNTGVLETITTLL